MPELYRLQRRDPPTVQAAQPEHTFLQPPQRDGQDRREGRRPHTCPRRVPVQDTEAESSHLKGSYHWRATGSLNDVLKAGPRAHATFPM